MDADVLIVGAGPAGCTAALNLAPFRRVVMVDRWAAPRPRVGESLPAASRRLLADMGLWEDFVSDGHAPAHAFRSAWGGAEPVVRDALTDPEGHGWHLDRLRFESRLRAVALARGARLLAPARPWRVTRDPGGWRVGLEHEGRNLEVRATLLIDAAGRTSRTLAGHGARRVVVDRLICGWVSSPRAQLPPGVTQIEAESEGWWYATPLPGGGGLLAFHTDGDLPGARACRSPAELLARARSLPLMAPLLLPGDWGAVRGGHCAAHAAWLEEPVGDGWLAAGDAALAFDPLAARGLFNALYTGLAAAEAADRALGGDVSGLEAIGSEFGRIRSAYQLQHASWYALEDRWHGYPFWARRRSATAAAFFPK